MITYYYFYPDVDAPNIDSISILEEYRGKKYGTLLINKFFKDLKSTNYHLIRLKTWSTNKITTKLYVKLGFKIFKVLKNDWGLGVDSIY